MCRLQAIAKTTATNCAVAQLVSACCANETPAHVASTGTDESHAIGEPFPLKPATAHPISSREATSSNPSTLAP
jgi:hypothetical protein